MRKRSAEISGQNWEIAIDQQCRWFCDKQPVEHPGVLAAFQGGLCRAADGRNILRIANDWCYV